MDVNLYIWKNAPQIAASYSPFTEWFFSEGGKVVMVMIVKNAESDEIMTILRHFATPPSDSAFLKDTRIYYWTVEGKNRV
jgi:hypothetical protein